MGRGTYRLGCVCDRKRMGFLEAVGEQLEERYMLTKGMLESIKKFFQSDDRLLKRKVVYGS